MKKLLIISAALLWAGCASSPSGKKAGNDTEALETAASKAHAAEERTRPTALSREAAILRAHQIGHVAYELWFGLDGEHDDYEGRVVINFEVRQKAKDHSKNLVLDFEEGSLRDLTLNGASLADFRDPSRYDGHRVAFKMSELRAGINQVKISFSHKFSKNGSGLYRFQDPVDNAVYLYSDFEPYSAHRMFPCFDQPDLKASYELTVEAPEGWQVISNTMERDVSTVDGRRSWAFPPSPLLSTYLFALHAGPYKMWKSDAEGIPLRLFARKSMAQYVDYKEWLDVTRDGLEHYSTLFGYPYPYSKYDQIIVPDFNAGAMENAAAITFSEHYIFRTKMTEDRHRDRADTILHEMAHQWFGDLVTMKWWNGLWLNESFATFMAAGAVDQATRFKGSWQAFFAEEKEWAYWEDQLVTSHPIEVHVADTDQAFSNFDGITYGKGASVLKQLAYFLGEDDFREGIQRYFQKYALRNTTIGDFIKMLAEASGQDLAHWAPSWLQTIGVNGLKADWDCAADPDTGKSRITRFNLLQTGSEQNPDLRTHKTKVALFRAKARGGKLEPAETFDVVYAKAVNSVPEAIGKACPEMVFPNYQDQDYVKVELDPVSLEAVRKRMSSIPDPFVRQMVWHTLWEMVIDGKLRPQDYAELVFAHAARETSTQVLEKILGTLDRPSAESDSVIKFLPSDLRGKYKPRIEEFLRGHLIKAPAGSDLQLVWFDAFLGAAASDGSVQYARALLSGKSQLRGLKIDEEKRWSLIEALARNNDSEELIRAELKKDPTENGARSAIAAEASKPDPAGKQRWLDLIVNFPFQKQGNAASGLGAAPVPVPTPAPTTPGPSASPGAPGASTAVAEPAAPTSTPLVEITGLARIREAMRHFQIMGQEPQIRASMDAYFNMIPKLTPLEDEEYIASFARSMYPAICDQAVVDRTTQVLQAHPELPAPVVKTLKVHRQEEQRCIRARAKAAS